MPLAGQPSPQRGVKYQQEAYTREEMRAFLAKTSSDAPSAIRNKALFATLWQSGLRISEALDLRPVDFDLAAPDIFVRSGKGGKARHVRPGPVAVQTTERWLEVRSEMGIGRDAPLYCTFRGTRMTGSYVRQNMNRIAHAAGWERRPHPHGLRHSFTVELVKAGVPVPMIQKQLGHTSLATTSTYLAGITSADVQEAMKGVWDEDE